MAKKDYLLDAAQQIRMALDREVNEDYEAAFSYYKNGVDLLLNGVQGHNVDTLQSNHTAEAGAAQKQERCKPGAEFVEKHRTELIRRVSLVEPIADDMKPLIGEEKYQIILNSGTRQAQMRALLDFLTTSKLKENLYQSLVKHDKFLVEDLEDCV
ncbi:hypothetical protein cypCar_00045896 [Cyprinus carpio]|nr:hypothetical protein cypCar_00045896 [Cyprinus carpio]